MDHNNLIQGNPVEQGHCHAQYGRASVVDKPPSPPFSFYWPVFSECGTHNCGNHNYAVRDLQRPLTDHAWQCHGCEQHFNLVTMHHLPCGHTICRGCLNLKAMHFHSALQENKAQVDLMLSNMAHLERTCYFVGSAMSTFEIDDQASALLLQAQTLLGLTCCEQDARYERFLYCMNRDVAMRFFLDLKYLSSRPHLQDRCGWPDCATFVPPLAFQDRRGLGPVIQHCPTCLGNGQLVGCSPGNMWAPSQQPLMARPFSYGPVDLY